MGRLPEVLHRRPADRPRPRGRRAGRGDCGGRQAGAGVEGGAALHGAVFAADAGPLAVSLLNALENGRGEIMIEAAGVDQWPAGL